MKSNNVRGLSSVDRSEENQQNTSHVSADSSSTLFFPSSQSQRANGFDVFKGKAQEKQLIAEWEATIQKWGPPPALGDAMGNLEIFLLDLDYGAETPSQNAAISKRCEFNAEIVPIIRIYGVTGLGQSVLLHIHGYFPYFYCECPPLRQDCNLLRKQLESVLGTGQTPGKNLKEKILDVQIVQKKSLMYYSPQKPYFKVVAALPKMIPTCRTAIENGMSIEDQPIPPTAYEANIPFTLRFLVDANISGCSWIGVSKDNYFVRPLNKRSSRCQLEMDVYYKDLESLGCKGDWQKIPPLRLLSFDIECVKETGQGFPEAHLDPVIQISSSLLLQGESKAMFQAIFTYGSCAPIAGAAVFSFESERDMLSHWAEFLRRVDPDILTGYNCINFDLAYLIQRSLALKMDDLFRQMGRLNHSEAKIKDSTFSSRAFGTHENKEINTEGRVQFDILDIVRREYKLKYVGKCGNTTHSQYASYTLNNVSFEFLKEQKEDIHYSMIGDLHRGSAETRKRIAVYCLKDAYLPLRLNEKLMLLVNSIEMARVTGTTLAYLFSRGQQIKVTSQLYRKCKELEYIIPCAKRYSPNNDSGQYEGGTVLAPEKGFYLHPIATLDFASLYPSIMIAHNLCYSTLIPPHRYGTVDEGYVHRTPTQPIQQFVTAKLQKGVLPMIVEELLLARKQAKKEMAEATDPFSKMVLNGRQLALKITANSVYGYTGATSGGQLPCLEVASSITCHGRDMILHCKNVIEKIYSVANGVDFNARVVYGDTDSVMVTLGDLSVAKVMEIGKEMAQRVTKEFIPPIKLEFEKVYCPLLLMNKKRYAGLLFTNPAHYDRMDTKGIETVRRDFCPLVQQMVDTVLKKMLIERDVESAKEYVQKKVSELLQNKVDLSLLVATKSLGKMEYDTNLPHVEVAKKLKKRDSGTAPVVGDRVSYIIIKGTKGQPQYERAEDPLYVLDNDLSIDTQHYLECIRGPILRIFEALKGSYESLFTGDHTRTITLLTSKDGALSKFLTKSLQCVSCKAIIKSGAFCRNCRETKGMQTILMKLNQMRALENEFSSLWIQCQRCQMSLYQDIICSNRDCPIFYRRAKVRKDMQSLQETVDRISIEW